MRGSFFSTKPYNLLKCQGNFFNVRKKYYEIFNYDINSSVDKKVPVVSLKTSLSENLLHNTKLYKLPLEYLFGVLPFVVYWSITLCSLLEYYPL